MSVIIACFALGVLMLALELVVPGAILGIIGGISMLIGVVVSFSEFGGFGGLVATVAAILALGLTVYLEFVWLPKSRLVKAIMVDATMDATSQPALANEQEIVGRDAEAVTVLAPSGYVLVDGRRYEAFSQSGMVTVGTRLRVVGLDNFRLIVTHNQNTP